MKIFNDTAKNRISQAYDMFKRDQFLDRLFDFLDNSEDLIYEMERRKREADELCQKIIEGVKTKPGPKAKTELELNL